MQPLLHFPTGLQVGIYILYSLCIQHWTLKNVLCSCTNEITKDDFLCPVQYEIYDNGEGGRVLIKVFGLHFITSEMFLHVASPTGLSCVAMTVGADDPQNGRWTDVDCSSVTMYGICERDSWKCYFLIYSAVLCS